MFKHLNHICKKSFKHTPKNHAKTPKKRAKLHQKLSFKCTKDTTPLKK